MQGRVGEVADRLGRILPTPVVKRLVAQALGRQNVALCLHRVLEERRPTDWQPSLTIPPAELDALISLLLATRKRTPRPWLTVTFDDGYLDAARYIESRVVRFPDVEWIFFVCPAKLEQRAGFRWDAGERSHAADPARSAAAEVMAPMDLASENARAPLREVAALPDYALASVEDCLRLQRLPQVSLGNHTNSHHLQTRLTPDQVQVEYQQSLRDFTRLFGEQRHFAFPFGDYAARHVSALRALGDYILWSTEPRPHAPGERVRGAVIPRYAVDGQDSHQAIALWIAARALVARVQGPRPLHWNEAASFVP